MPVPLQGGGAESAGISEAGRLSAAAMPGMQSAECRSAFCFVNASFAKVCNSTLPWPWVDHGDCAFPSQDAEMLFVKFLCRITW